MKINFLKIKKDSLPKLESLKSKIFNLNLFWFLSLIGSFLVIAVTLVIGFKIFYSQYFENYKKSKNSENLENIINTERLNKVVEKRNETINKPTSLPRDPSL